MWLIRLRGRIWRVIMILVIFAMWNTTRLLFVLHPPAVHTPRPATGRVRTRTGNWKKHVWNLFCRNGAENTARRVSSGQLWTVLWSSVLNYYFFIFSQKRKGKKNSSMVYIDSYVRCLRGVTRYLLEWPDICANICRYLQVSADIYEGKCIQYTIILSSRGTTTMSPPPHADRALPEDRSRSLRS
jgi:hypothetical protein